MPTKERIGDTIEDAIVIMAKSTKEGLAKEYKYLDKLFGVYEKDWNLDMQILVDRGKKQYDRMIILLPKNLKKEVYFDVTSFFGKFPID